MCVRGRQGLVARSGALPRLLDLLSSTSRPLRECVCGVLGELAVSPLHKVRRCLVMRRPPQWYFNAGTAIESWGDTVAGWRRWHTGRIVWKRLP